MRGNREAQISPPGGVSAAGRADDREAERIEVKGEALAWLNRQPADVQAEVNALAYEKGHKVWRLDGFPKWLYQAVLPEAIREYRRGAVVIDAIDGPLFWMMIGSFLTV
ncbi:MAG: hypothetical protein OYK82_00970 [Gammaproteobacteria bacterium]|nr:hypothetical protein [Gammaproteobacteria bacterium]